MEKFSISEVIRFSWESYKKNWKNLLLVFLLLATVTYVPGLIAQFLRQDYPLISLLVNLISALVNIVVNIGLLKIMLNTVDGRDVNIQDLFFAFSKLGLVGKYLLTSVIYGFIILLSGLPVGLFSFFMLGNIYNANRFSQNINTSYLIIFIPLTILFVGIIFMIVTKFQFWNYLLVDKEMWEFTGLRKSWNMTKGFVLHLILFGFTLLLLNLVGLIALFVGLVVTLPVSMLAMARVYRILEQGKSVPAAPAVTPVSVNPAPVSPPSASVV